MTGYKLAPTDRVLQHGVLNTRWQQVLCLHDFAADLSHADIDAIVASGDYFGSLATSLDTISQDLKNAGNDTEHLNIEKLINALLYIETKYKITRL